MKISNLLLIISILFAISSCNNKPKESNLIAEPVVIDNRIDSITILYYNYLREPSTPIKVEDIKLDLPKFEIDRKGILDAHITDSMQITALTNKIDLLKPMKQSAPLDARLVATIKYKDGRTAQLCLGGKYVNEIFLDGTQQENNNELIFILKNYAGFYPWMIGDDMFAMKELQDNSFPKAPFSSTVHYNEYQKVLANR